MTVNCFSAPRMRCSCPVWSIKRSQMIWQSSTNIDIAALIGSVVPNCARISKLTYASYIIPCWLVRMCWSACLEKQAIITEVVWAWAFETCANAVFLHPRHRPDSLGWWHYYTITIFSPAMLVRISPSHRIGKVRRHTNTGFLEPVLTGASGGGDLHYSRQQQSQSERPKKRWNGQKERHRPHISNIGVYLLTNRHIYSTLRLSGTSELCGLCI